MESPIYDILTKWEYSPWSSAHTQREIRKEILALNIDGLIDVNFEISNNGNHVQVTPVFATEKDYMWYNLKYDNTL